MHICLTQLQQRRVLRRYVSSIIRPRPSCKVGNSHYVYAIYKQETQLLSELIVIITKLIDMHFQLLIT